MKKILLSFISFLVIVTAYGQQAVRGKVIDFTTKEPLAFANIIFNNDASMRIISDIDGYFFYRTEREVQVLNCSYVGYHTTSVPISSLTLKKEILIALTPSESILKEVLVVPGENPANRIIIKAISNKKRNNPENISSFTYECYNKTVADFKVKPSNTKDSIYNQKLLKGGHLMLMESVTKRKFIAPNTSEEEVVATRVSGFNKAAFASLATDIQPFSFYQDHIKLMNLYYLNPISNGSLKKYKFHLEETIAQGKDTVFVISFQPQRNKNFDGLKGVLYINSNHYAIQNVIASPFEKSKVSLRIQQQYQFIEEHWFPEQLNYVLQFEQYPTKATHLVFDGKSYLSKVTFGTPFKKKDFALESVLVAEDASQKDSLFWKPFRKEPLNGKDLKTYTFLDSLGAKKHFDYYVSVLEKLAKKKFPISFVDLDLSKTFQYNEFEGTRIGTGVYTNELLFKSLSLGGFLGYGTKDHLWKYGYEMDYDLDKRNEISIALQHQNNLHEIGNSGLREYNHGLFNFRNYLASQFDQIHQNSLVFYFRALRDFKGKINLSRTDVKALYPAAFEFNPTLYDRYKNSAVDFFLRFAFKEKIVQSFHTNYSMGTKYPIVYFQFSKGFKNLFQGDFDYTKIELAVEQTFYTRNLGQTHFRLETGYLDSALPIGLLYTSEGSYQSQQPFFTENTFQTMKPYEFVSDQYANLFLSHNFGTLLFKTSFFQPSLSWHQNLSWGRLVHNHFSLKSSYKTKEKVFLESGLQLDNIFKWNAMNIGYFGIGSGVFYRYGSYANPDTNDNLVYKVTLHFTVN